MLRRAMTAAETAITIDDIVTVINSGRLKEKSFDPYTAVSTLQVPNPTHMPSPICFCSWTCRAACGDCATKIDPILLFVCKYPCSTAMTMIMSRTRL